MLKCEFLCTCLCHLSFVHGYVAVEFLRLVVWRAMGGKPHAEVMLSWLAATGQGEDVNILHISLEELGQEAAETHVSALHIL